jgi:hypothetical protein
VAKGLGVGVWRKQALVLVLLLDCERRRILTQHFFGGGLKRFEEGHGALFGAEPPLLGVLIASWTLPNSFHKVCLESTVNMHFHLLVTGSRCVADLQIGHCRVWGSSWSVAGLLRRRGESELTFEELRTLYFWLFVFFFAQALVLESTCNESVALGSVGIAEGGISGEHLPIILEAIISRPI